MDNYSGKVAVITGASSGIGAEIAVQLAHRNAQVVGLDIVPNDGDHMTSYRCDVTKLDSVQQIVAEITEKFGKIDILVNCAGIVALDSAETLPTDYWHNTIDINLTGTFFMCQTVGRAMLKDGGGKIINLASQAGVVGIDKHVAYCASKFGVIGMTKVLAIEWAQHNINVNCVSPTVVMTELGKKAWSGDVATAMKQKIPARRFAEPSEIADTVLFLASDKSAMIHGENIVVDGGYTAQ